MVVACLLTWTAVAAPEAKEVAQKTAEDRNIRISADKLNFQVDAGQIEYVGNVRATQADTVVTSDQLIIYYEPQTGNTRPGTLRKESIKKIIAAGDVTIIYGDITAETDRAEYVTKSGIFTLTGYGSKVTRRGQSISGAKFTLYRSDGRLIVESGAENRVKAVISGAEETD